MERERQRVESEEARRYLSASQQPLRTHRPPHSSHSHQSPKRSHYMQQPTGHSESRLMGPSDPHMGAVMYMDRRTRSSREDKSRRVSEQRRRSADAGVLVKFDHSSPPFPARGVSHSSVLQRELSQSHQELLPLPPPHNMTSAETGESFEHYAPREQRESRSSTHGSSRRANRQVKKSSPKPNSKAIPSKTNVLSSFDDSESSEGGSSQSCATLSQSDIHLTVEDDKVTLKSASSTSTLISVGNSPPRNGSQPTPSSHKHDVKELSQEQFNDDDHSEMMSLATLAAVPQSSQPMYYDFMNLDMHEGVPPLPYLVKTEQLAQGGLSQPTISPPKSRYGKSLTDLTNSGSNSNLAYSQSLSQSVVDVPYYYNTHGRYEQVPPGHSRPYIKPAHSNSHGHLHQSDPHLNAADGPPGLSRSVAAALTNIREEMELKQHRQQRRAMYPGHSHKQHSMKQRRQVTSIPEERQEKIKTQTSEKQVMTAPKVEVTTVPDLPSVPEPRSSPTSSARRLNLGGKSDSTSSLSMEIL